MATPITKIAMIYPSSYLRVRNLTINSGNKLALNMFGHVNLHLSINLFLDITSFGNYLILIAMTHIGKNEGNIHLIKVTMTYLLEHV